MSDSPKTSLARITINAGDPVTEIFLINSDLHRVAQAVGFMSTDQPPGIYQVKLRVGPNTQEDLIKVSGPFDKTYPPLAFSSPVPLKDTIKTHESHVVNAEAQSRIQRCARGSGSFIYVFARDWTSKNAGEKQGGSYPHPARGLTLRDKAGVELVNFETDSLVQLKWEPWAACNVSINPGSYILRLDAPDGSVWERTLVASPNWQTECFLLQRDFGESRGPDLAGATVLTRRQDLGFAADEFELRLVELARLALIDQRPILSNEVEDLLTRKFNNPHLGIFGAHLLIDLQESRDRACEPGLLQSVIEKLRGVLQEPHPDVEALACKAGMQDKSYKFEMPPMIRRSWALITHASAEWSEAIPAESMNNRIYNRILAEEPWLVWSGEQQSSDESCVVDTLSLYLDAQDAAEERLSNVASGSTSEAPLSLELTQRDGGQTSEVRQLTQQLSIPRSVVEQYLPTAKKQAEQLKLARHERSARKKRVRDSV